MSGPNRDRLRARLRPILAALTAVLAVIGGTVIVFDSDGPGPKPAHTVTIPKSIPFVSATVDSADPGRAPDVALKTPAPVLDQTAQVLEQGLRAESPTPGNLQAQEDAAKRDDLPIVQADAAPSQRGCLSRFVVNYSSRRGVAPRVLFLHETVSPNRPGWSDVNAIGVQFNQPRSAASSTYTLDREGHCLYLVRESDKPWTQAAANPWAISFEIINSATRADRNLIDGPGRRLLLSILNDASKRWDIPLRRARLSNCTPTRAGITDHNSLGPCGGGHVDVSPFRSAIDPIISDARRLCVKRYHDAGHVVPGRCKA
jgi:hypothetical protein